MLKGYLKDDLGNCRKVIIDDVGGVFLPVSQIDEEFSFSLAIELLKQGEKIARKGWNGKGMFVVYQKGYPQGIPCNKQTAEAWGLNEGDLFVCNPYLQIKCANGSHSMWVPSINDVLAEDWVIIE